jgi:hypothetical protein
MGGSKKECQEKENEMMAITTKTSTRLIMVNGGNVGCRQKTSWHWMKPLDLRQLVLR